MSFKQSLSIGKIGENIQLFAWARHIPEIDGISFPTSDGSNSRDVTISIATDNISGELSIDIKTDFWYMKTGNCVFEVISQAKNLSNPYDKEGCVRPKLNETMSDLISEKKLKLSYEEKGWLIKDLQSNRRVSVLCLPCKAKELTQKSHIVHEYLENLYCNNQNIGADQVKALRLNHDQLMKDLNFKKYKFFLMKKIDMLSFLKDTFENSSYKVGAVPNSGYHTLNYYVPASRFCKNSWCREFTWQAS